MEAPWPDFVCPRCRGPLEARGSAYRCRACDAAYPIVAGIPDFRVFPDPWIGLEEDREKARRLATMVEGCELEEALRAYWSITPSTPREDAERFVEHCLGAAERSRQWLRRLDGRAGGPDRPPAPPWMDLGCGTADLAAVAGSRTVGVDIALRWLVVARRRPGVADGDVRLVCACAEALPFPDGSFGRVLSLGLLAHVPDPAPVFSEARRVLVPGARTAFRTVNRYTLLPEPHVGVWGVGFLPRRWADAYVRWSSGRRYRHHRPLSPRELRRAMSGADLEEVTVEAAPTLEAEAGRLPGPARRLLPVYETARTAPGIRHLTRWVAPLLEARGRRP